MFSYRRFLRLAFGLSAILLVLAGPIRSEDKPIALKGQRVFTAGHSFHWWVPPILSELAQQAKIEGHTEVGVQKKGGSKVIEIWNLPERKDIAKPALKTGKVDVLTLSPINLPDEGIENFVKLALEHNPEIRVTVQEFWLPFDEEAAWEKKPKAVNRNDKSIEELRKAHADYFKSMDDHVRSLNEKLKKQVLYIVPSGQAVLTLREKVIAGKAPGIKDQASLFKDAVGHPQRAIEVLAGYCHFAVIYRKSPIGLPVPKSLDPRQESKQTEDSKKLNALLQEIAWEAVNNHPLSGVNAAKNP